MWNIVFLDEAEKDMKRLDSSVRLQVLKGIQKVAKNPLSADQGAMENLWATKAVLISQITARSSSGIWESVSYTRLKSSTRS